MYIMTILLSILLVLTPYILLVFIHFNFCFIQQAEFIQLWGTFFEEFHILYKRADALYYVLFFIRRLVIAVAVILFRNSPLIQGILCLASCLSMLIYVSIFRPYNTRLMNVVQILNELSISVAYGLSGMFYFDTGLDVKIHSWSIESCVYFSYFLHVLVILHNLGNLAAHLYKKYNLKEKVLRCLRRYRE